MKAKNYFPQKIRYFAAGAELANETFCRKPYIFRFIFLLFIKQIAD